MLFKSRAWHVKIRPNVADHLLQRYNRGIYQVTRHMHEQLSEQIYFVERQQHRVLQVLARIANID